MEKQNRDKAPQLVEVLWNDISWLHFCAESHV